MLIKKGQRQEPEALSDPAIQNTSDASNRSLLPFFHHSQKSNLSQANKTEMHFILVFFVLLTTEFL